MICLVLSLLSVWRAFATEDPTDCASWADGFRRPQPTLEQKALLLLAENPATDFLHKTAFIKGVSKDEVTIMMVWAKPIPAEKWSGAIPANAKTIRDKTGKVFVVEYQGKPGSSYFCQQHPRRELEQALRDARPAGAPEFALRPIVAPEAIDVFGSHIKWYLLFDTVWFALLLGGFCLIALKTHGLLWVPFGAIWTTALFFTVQCYPTVATASDLFHRTPVIQNVLHFFITFWLLSGVWVVLGFLIAYFAVFGFRLKPGKPNKP